MTSTSRAHVLNQSKKPGKMLWKVITHSTVKHFPNWIKIFLNMEYESESITYNIRGHHYDLIFREQLFAEKPFEFIFHELNKFRAVVKKAIVKVQKMQEDNQNPEEHTDTINCRCSSCQNKFGGLPLLIEGIERREDHAVNRSEPVPSTSTDLSPPSRKKLIKCVHCDKTFTHKGDYNKHLRKHTGEKPFVCSICGKNFAHASNLSRHMRLHSGDKPYVCETCQKSFSRKDKLELHRRSCNKT